MNFSQLSIDRTRRATAVRLSSLLRGVPVSQMFGPFDAEVAGITTDSRRVTDRWMFVATEGEHVDGHAFVQRAIEQGASVIVVQERQYRDGLHELLSASYVQHNTTTVLVVRDTREAVGLLADRYYGSPAAKLRLVGITGTNGKTTSSYLMKSVLERSGEKTGLIGTIASVIGKDVVPASFTTPPAEELHRLLASMVAAGCTSAVMEVSSHALALRRVEGIVFDTTLFTNFTQDHLDFHGSMEAYRDAKALLFRDHTRLGAAFNIDDPAWRYMASGFRRRRASFGQAARATHRIMDLQAGSAGTRFTLRHEGGETRITSALAGGFNAWNLAGVYAAASILGIEDRVIVRGLRAVRAVPGRFERIVSADGVTAVVDYSHTPDALEKAALAARALLGPDGRLIVVFGCGGDRDQAKRPLMGAVASRVADLTIVTSDNPRSEDPEAIINDILAGVRPDAAVERRPRRRAAIERALRLARPGDIVLIAGKGHETYQLVGRKRLDFDDRAVARVYFETRRGGVAA